MMVDSHDPHARDALLVLAEMREYITNAEQLRVALARLSLLHSGETASLSRDARHYVRATRRGGFWSVVVRGGGWWTVTSFTAELTTDYSARQVRESRAAGSLWKRLSLMFAAPEHGLSTSQVETIFMEYHLGHRFSIPLVGA